MQVQENTPIEQPQGTLPRSQPRGNISETESAYRIELLVPGVKANAVDLSVEKDVLSFEGEAHFAEPDGLSALRREIGPVSFARQFRLPDDVDRDAISAKLNDGVLTLDLPKREAAKPRTISLS